MAELAAYTIWVPTLLMVVFRLAGLFLTAPVLSHPSVPPQMKTILCIVVALAVTGRLPQPVALPNDWPSLVLGIGGEMLIGATMGYAAGLLFMGIELAAEHIGQQLGITLATVFNPLFQDASNVLGTLLSLTALSVFLIIGGHRMLLQALIATFGDVPLLEFSMRVDVLNAVVALLGAAFMLAVKISAPVMVAMFLASLSMGFIQRTMPQLNILSAGFQIRILLGLMVIVGSLAMLLPLVQSMWDIILQQLVRIF